MGRLLGQTREVTDKARAFHWPLEFPDVMSVGGFHVVLGNPPWERIKLQEQEFFAAREPEIAMAANADARGQDDCRAEEAPKEQGSAASLKSSRRRSEPPRHRQCLRARAGRFPLTGQGDVNTYALFAELFSDLVNSSGRAGVIIADRNRDRLHHRAFLR